MHFASIGSLWLSLSLPLIVLLYLLKRRYIDTEVSSHLLWSRVLQEQEANKPWQRLRKHLLLLLQLLATALFVLALLQPYLSRALSAKAHVVIVLDASASMQASAEGGTRLAAAKAEILRFAEEEAQGSSFTLLAIREQPELLLQQQSGLDGLKSALDHMSVHFGHAAYKETLSLASALTREDPNSEVRLFTDGQWTESASGLDFRVPVTVTRIPAASIDTNVSILQFGVKADPNKSKLAAAASVKNWGELPAAFDAVLYADQTAVEVRKVNLQPGEQQTLFFDELAPSSVYKLLIEAQDSLSEDNSAYGFSSDTGSKRALLVSEGNLFLEKALGIAKVEVLKIQRGEGGAYAAPSGTEPDFVVLDGVEPAQLEGPAWQRLLLGKPLWIFAGGEGSGSGIQVSSPPYEVADHPVTRYIRLQDSLIASAHTQKGMDWGKAIVTADQVPLVYAGTVAGKPRLFFAFQLQQSDLPLRAEFPVLVQNAVSWLAGNQAQHLGRAIAGENIEIQLAPEVVQASWLPVDPAGGVLPADQNQSQLTALQKVPAAPGLYTFEEKDQQGTVIQSRWMEVSMDAREANINRQSELGFKSVGGEPAASADRASDQQAESAASALTLAPWIAALLILLLLTEWEVYRRGYSV